MYIYKSSRHLSKVGCFSLSLVCILKTVFREYLSVCPLTLAPMSLNPRMVWCYTGEDFMSKIRPLASSSSYGNAMWGITDKATQQYVRALDMTLRDPAVWLGTLV